MDNLKQQLFMGLFNQHYGEEGVSLDDLVNKTMLVDAKLNQDQMKLEDIREGEFSKVTLDQAVEKLAFELQNDRDLYRAYENKLSYVIYNSLDENERIDVKDKERAAEFAESVAKTFLDAYINDALRTKEKNKEYKEAKQSDELKVEF